MNLEKKYIGIDASFSLGEKTGTSEYANNIIKNLVKIDKFNEYTLFPFFTYIYNPEFKLYQPNLPENFHIFWKNIPKKAIDILWHRLKIFRKVYLQRFDLFHTTTFSVPPSFMYTKLVVTIYDVSFYTHPQFHLKENVDHCLKSTREAVKKADIIIAISEHTKQDLIKYFDCPKNKIIVTQLACDEEFYKKVSEAKKNKVIKKYRIQKPFIFHLGSLEPRKNTLGLIKAFHLLPKSFQDKFDLIIAGGKGWLNTDIYRYLSAHDLGNRIKLIGYVNAEDLPAIYQIAKCFVYPSFYEGFGIPPIEAMASGCPVLVSNTSSLPEICSDSANYCDPKDVEDIKKKTSLLLSGKNIDKINKGKEQAKKFSWIKCSQETLAIYKSLFTG